MQVPKTGQSAMCALMAAIVQQERWQLYRQLLPIGYSQ